MTLHDLVGAYALHALDPDDLLAFEDHLPGCSACRDAVATFQDAASGLGATGALDVPGTARRAPEGLRGRVLTAARSAPQADADAGTPSGGAGAADFPPSADHSRVPAWRWVTGIAAAAAAVVLGVVVGVSLVNEPAEQELAAHEDAMRIMSAPDAQSVAVPLGRSTFVMSESFNGALLMGDLAPMPAGGMEYQVWTSHGGDDMEPGPTFMPDADGSYLVLLAGDMDGLTWLCVTEEPMGGSAAPTSDPVVGVTIGGQGQITGYAPSA